MDEVADSNSVAPTIFSPSDFESGGLFCVCRHLSRNARSLEATCDNRAYGDVDPSGGSILRWLNYLEGQSPACPWSLMAS